MIVLLSPVGGQAIHGIIEYFKERGNRVIGIDGNPEAIGRHFVDAFHLVPRVEDPQYAERVLGVICKERVGLFISWLDPEIRFWNERNSREGLPAEIERAHTFNLRPELGQFYDKLECARLLSLAGFLVPDTSSFLGYKPSTFPFILKPRISTGSRNVFTVGDRASWDAHVSAGKSWYVAQQFLMGPEYTVDFFADRGKLVNAVVRQRLEAQGVSLRGEVVESPALLAIVERIVLRFAIDGLNNIQFIEQGGNYYAIDFNLRPSGTIMLSVRAGVDLLNNLIERKEGKPLTIYAGPRKVKMVRYLKEHYYE